MAGSADAYSSRSLSGEVQEAVVHALHDDAHLGPVGQRARGLPEPGHGLHEEAPPPPSPFSKTCRSWRRRYNPPVARRSPCVPRSTIAARLDHDELVGAPDGGKPVRDHERRAARHEALERLLDRALALGVERRRRLVEDEDRRVLEERARDRETLALAAREARAALPHARVEPVGEGVDERERVRGARGPRGSALRARPACRRRRCAARVSSKRTTSCVTRPIRARSDARVTSRRSVPSTVTRPDGRVHEAREQGRERRLAAARTGRRAP